VQITIWHSQGEFLAQHRGERLRRFKVATMALTAQGAQVTRPLNMVNRLPSGKGRAAIMLLG
jgi:hypothetical protein